MPVDPDDIQAGEHIFLVAFCITDERERDAAQHLLINRLDSWWMAEDDRLDGNDCDSAVFVPQGETLAAIEFLAQAGFYEDAGAEDEEET